MTRTKLIRLIIIIVLAGIIVGGGGLLYVFKTPHRNIEKTEADYKITASSLVQEYLSDNQGANNKYLSADGNSKILEVSGEIFKTSRNMDGQLNFLLRSENDLAGVSCTFTKDSDGPELSLKVGDKVIIKGVIRSGAAFDKDLDMYENVIIEKCLVIQ